MLLLPLVLLAQQPSGALPADPPSTSPPAPPPPPQQQAGCQELGWCALHPHEDCSHQFIAAQVRAHTLRQILRLQWPLSWCCHPTVPMQMQPQGPPRPVHGGAVVHRSPSLWCVPPRRPLAPRDPVHRCCRVAEGQLLLPPSSGLTTRGVGGQTARRRWCGKAAPAAAPPTRGAYATSRRCLRGTKPSRTPSSRRHRSSRRWRPSSANSRWVWLAAAAAPPPHTHTLHLS